MFSTLNLTLSPALILAGFTASTAFAATSAINYGSLGSVADGVYNGSVVENQPSPILAPGDVSNTYSAGARTTVAYNSALNPASASPFTVEFWANPSASDNDDTPLSNRFVTGTNRSGWTFFQRAAGTGWNFRMYNGVGTAVGWDLTGGTSNLNAWSHVVATWDGSAAQLYVNGSLVDNVNDATAASKTYNANSALDAPSLNVAANFDGGSPSTASVDEVAIYGSALTAAQITNHYSLATTSNVAGAYANAVKGDGALLYLPMPEPTSTVLLGVFGMFGLKRRRK